MNREILDDFINDFSIEKLFVHGLYHRYDGVRRLYLDHMFDKNNEEKIKFVYNTIEPILGESYYVCLSSFSDTPPNETESIFKFIDSKLASPSEIKFVKKYMEDDEGYCIFLIYKDSKLNLLKYISGIINTVNLGEIIINYEVFFMDLYFNTIIDVYDDRGMDILNVNLLKHL